VTCRVRAREWTALPETQVDPIADVAYTCLVCLSTDPGGLPRLCLTMVTAATRRSAARCDSGRRGDPPPEGEDPHP